MEESNICDTTKSLYKTEGLPKKVARTSRSTETLCTIGGQRIQKATYRIRQHKISNTEEKLRQIQEFLSNTDFAGEYESPKELTTDIEISLQPQKITTKQYQKYVPKKIELINGDLYMEHTDGHQLLKLLLYNVGLQEAVKLFPKALLLKALNQTSENSENGT